MMNKTLVFMTLFLSTMAMADENPLLDHFKEQTSQGACSNLNDFTSADFIVNATTPVKIVIDRSRGFFYFNFGFFSPNGIEVNFALKRAQFPYYTSSGMKSITVIQDSLDGGARSETKNQINLLLKNISEYFNSVSSNKTGEDKKLEIARGQKLLTCSRSILSLLVPSSSGKQDR